MKQEAKQQNNNPLYYLYGLPVKDAVKSEYYGCDINVADARNAVKEHPTRCIKALHLKRVEGTKGELDVIVLRTTVLIKHPGDKFHTRYVDGARIQQQFDDEGKRGDVDEMFALRPPHGARSHTERRGPRPQRAPRKPSRYSGVPNMSRLTTLKGLIKKHETDTD